MAGHGIHISYYTRFVIYFPSHFILLCVWFSLFSPICCPLDYKMKMHNGNIEFRQTLSVCFSHSFNISRSLSLSVKYGCWQSLCRSEDTHRDRSWFLSLALLWKQVSVCVLWERYTNRCVYRQTNVLVVMLFYSKSKTAIYLTNMSNLTATFLSMLWVFIVRKWDSLTKSTEWVTAGVLRDLSVLKLKLQGFK